MFLASLQGMILFALAVGLFIVEVWGLIDAARRPASAFVSAGKRSKQFWVLLLLGGALVGFLSLPLGGPGMGGSFLMFAAVIPAGIYLADVRPAVAPYSRRRRPPHQGGGGGW